MKYANHNNIAFSAKRKLACRRGAYIVRSNEKTELIASSRT